MRGRFFVLLLPLLSSPMPTLAAPLQCEGAPVDSSLSESERVKQLADRAFACVKERKPLQSIALFSELIGIEPDNALAYINRGSTYARMHQLDMSLKDFDRVIELEPDRFEGWYNRGSTRLAADRYDEAIADLTKATSLKPDLARGYCNRGLAYLRKGAHEKARADFAKGLSLQIDMPVCYVGRGEVHLAEGRYRDAIEDLTRGINFKPTAESLTRRATAYEQLGERRKALADYRSALSLHPRLETAQAGVARLTESDQE